MNDTNRIGSKHPTTANQINETDLKHTSDIQQQEGTIGTSFVRGKYKVFFIDLIDIRTV